MIETIGAIGGLLFFVTVFLHVYLSSKADNKISFFEIGAYQTPYQLFLPFYDDVPSSYKKFKKAINVIYGIDGLLIIIFLIGKTISYFFGLVLLLYSF